MKRGFRLVMLGVFVVALLSLATWTRAQPAYAARPVTPVVFSGADVGFRMTGVTGKGDTPLGQLVVRVKGEWKVVEFGIVPQPATN